MLVRSGIRLIKYWFSVSDEEQERRFQDRMKKVTKRWKLSPMDLESRKHWADYSRAKDEMFALTDTKQAPWYRRECREQRGRPAQCHPPSALHVRLSRSHPGASAAASAQQIQIRAAAHPGAELYSRGIPARNAEMNRRSFLSCQRRGRGSTRGQTGRLRGHAACRWTRLSCVRARSEPPSLRRQLHAFAQLVVLLERLGCCADPARPGCDCRAGRGSPAHHADLAVLSAQSQVGEPGAPRAARSAA